MPPVSLFSTRHFESGKTVYLMTFWLDQASLAWKIMCKKCLASGSTSTLATSIWLPRARNPLHGLHQRTSSTMTTLSPSRFGTNSINLSLKPTVSHNALFALVLSHPIPQAAERERWKAWVIEAAEAERRRRVRASDLLRMEEEAERDGNLKPSYGAFTDSLYIFH